MQKQLVWSYRSDMPCRSPGCECGFNSEGNWISIYFCCRRNISAHELSCQVNLADNSIGEEGAASLATLWHSAKLRVLMQALVPGYPDTDLFLRPEEGDKAIADRYGFSHLKDHVPGRLRSIV